MTDEELIEAVAEAIEIKTIELQGKGVYLATGRADSDAFARAVIPVAQAPLLEGKMDAATLMKICRAWLGNDDASHWGDFEKALDDLLNRSTQ